MLQATAQPKTVTPPAKPAAKADVNLVAQPEPTIEGITIARPDGRWLGVTVGLSLTIKFYDREKNQVPADLTRALALWKTPGVKGEKRTILNSFGVDLLTSPPVFQPPYVYPVRLAFYSQDNTVVESYTVMLRPNTDDTTKP